MQSFHNKRHNHQVCEDQALNRAQQICEQKGLRFTEIRQRILQLIWSSHEPILAYELLKSLRQEKANAEPPTVYRALDFLLENQLIHKIESLNAYTGCQFPEKSHLSQFLICNGCNQIAELDNNQVNKVIQQELKLSGFAIEQQTIEIKGLCANCQP